MLKSMTGYGKSLCNINQKKFEIEIRTLNHKQLDISLRIPTFLKEKEHDLRNEIAEALQRGKVEIVVHLDLLTQTTTPILNEHIIRNYFFELKRLADDFKIPVNSDILYAILRMPESIVTSTHELTENEWKIFLKKFHEALNNVNKFRIQEGRVLEKNIIHSIKIILQYLKNIEPLEQERIKKIKKKLKSNLEKFFKESQIDKNRFEQELLYYIEKIDITEEKVRLKNHCNYFLEICKDKESQGRKLGFIAQEILREINTIGSKANDSDIQKIVVDMKDEIEKIKEQLLNVL